MAARIPSPDDVDMDTFAEESARSCMPPARIAARFSRTSSARRKSSAHSSRRNSLSSLHSHQSALSCHGGPRSTHVAQHLRRASIIESRKARLADREKHAEQVRLRAAMAKAAPRAIYREERVLAAQAAREKFLAEITARCEEEVRRAKKIAEDTKEKKAAEHIRLKEEMAEKFAEAARRRSIYQHNARRPRTSSIAAVDDRKVNPLALQRLRERHAVNFIQKAWRSHRRRKAVSDFVKLGLNVESVRSLAFEEVTKLISEERVQLYTAAVMEVLGLLESGNPDLGDRGGVRVFLSTFVILAHPVQVFSHGGKEPQEQDLMAKGGAMMAALDSCLTHPNPTKQQSYSSASEQDKLSYLFNDFSSAFHAWRSQDLTVIVDVMVNSFVNLDLILQTTKDDRAGHVADDYYQAIRHEQITLLARLKRLVGPDEALSKIRTAVRKARKQRATKMRRSSEENIPRTSSTTDTLGHVIQKTETDSPKSADITLPGSLPGTSSFINRLGQTMTVLPNNREIAHEMQINGHFEVQQQPWTDSKNHFMISLRTSMRASMERGDDDVAADWTHAMAVLIRDKLLSLISKRHPLYERIDGFLDPKLVHQQARNGLFSYREFFETIAGLIAQLCSPGRDESIRAFAADMTCDIIDKLFDLINIIDLMTLDHINFQFRMAAPSIIERGHEHEHTLFEQALRDNAHTTIKTQRWWTTARSSLASPAIPIPSGQAIYARALTDLVFSNTQDTISPTSLPETLSLDYIRLLTLRSRAFQMIATASILLTTKIRLRRNREALWSKDAERLMSLNLLDPQNDTARIVSLIETSHNMPESTKAGLTDFVGRVIPPAVAAGQKLQCAQQEHSAAIQSHMTYTPSSSALSLTPSSSSSNLDIFTEQISTYLLKSLQSHVFARLAASNTAERVRVNSSAAEVLARAGMPEFVNEVGAIVDMLERVRAVDLKAHGVWLEKIAREIAE